MDKEKRIELINKINISLETIAIINSFIDDGKTYYISLFEKVNDNFQDSLRKHFDIKTWTFDLTRINSDWKIVLKDELLFYFGQYIIQAKIPYIRREYEGLTKDLSDKKNKELILESRTNAEFLLTKTIDQIGNLVNTDSVFYKVHVNWDSPDGYERWYECYENDYIFDLGNELLFLHFGGSD